MLVCLSHIRHSYHEPEFRRTALRVIARLFACYLPDADPDALTPDEHELWHSLSLLEACTDPEKIMADREAQTFLDILNAHRPLVQRMAREEG